MALVTSKEIATVIGLDKFGFIGTFVGWLLISCDEEKRKKN